MRGDRPVSPSRQRILSGFTPHARGSTFLDTLSASGQGVYPACAGIDLDILVLPSSFSRLPRMRGDRPKMDLSHGTAWRFTPHARGSTSKKTATDRYKAVYPACAGIDPILLIDRWYDSRLPRMRGDRPSVYPLDTGDNGFTPHARGSTA